MGLGGYLMWTAVAREISNHTNLKILPIESHDPIIKMIESEVFHNNPYFIQPGEKFEYAFPLVLNNPQANYCKEDTPEKATHRYDKHVIGQICEVYGIQDPSLKCDLFLTDQELSSVNDTLLSVVKDDYIVIEPCSKTNYTLNRLYPFEKWQNIVNKLSEFITIVQIGQKTKNILENCINLTGSTTFREAAGIIQNAQMFIGSEGGLMHVANAMSTRSLIVVTGYQSPKMTCYPDNINMWINNNHGPCGLKGHCKDCYMATNNHNPQEIIDIIIRELSL